MTDDRRAQWLSFGAAWLGWVLDAFDFTVFLLVMPQIAQEFGVTITTTASSITLTLLVRLLGSFVAGWASDRYGRRLPLMVSIVWFAVFDGLIAVAPSFTWVLVLRTLFGFGMGAEWTAGATLAMENWPKASRGLASGLLQGGWAVGYLVAGVVAGALVPRFGWRSMFVAAALPALLAFPIRALVPESREWVAQHLGPKAPARLGAAAVRTIGWASVVLAFGFAGYFSLTNFLPTLLLKELHFTQGQVAGPVAVFNVGMLCGTAGCGLLATRVSPTRAIGWFVVWAPLAAMLLVGWAGPGWLWPGAFLAGAFAGGPAGVTPLWLATLFAPGLRARGTGLTYHLAAFAAAFTPFAMAAVAESGQGFARTMVGACALAAWLQVLVLLVSERSAPVEAQT